MKKLLPFAALLSLGLLVPNTSNPLTVVVARGKTANCPQANAAGAYQTWVYDAELVYTGGANDLPCGTYNILAFLSPGNIPFLTSTTLTLTGSPGDFLPAQGTPMALFYDEWGNMYGQEPVWYTGGGGAYVVFPSDPITNAATAGTFVVAVLNTNSDGSFYGGGDAAPINVYDPDSGGGGGGCNECD